MNARRRIRGASSAWSSLVLGVAVVAAAAAIASAADEPGTGPSSAFLYQAIARDPGEAPDLAILVTAFVVAPNAASLDVIADDPTWRFAPRTTPLPAATAAAPGGATGSSAVKSHPTSTPVPTTVAAVERPLFTVPLAWRALPIGTSTSYEVLGRWGRLVHRDPQLLFVARSRLGVAPVAGDTHAYEAFVAGLRGASTRFRVVADDRIVFCRDRAGHELRFADDGRDAYAGAAVFVIAATDAYFAVYAHAPGPDDAATLGAMRALCPPGGAT